MIKNEKPLLLTLLFLIQGVLALFLSLGIGGLVFHKGMPLPEFNKGSGQITVSGRNENLSLTISQFGKIFLMTLLIIGISLFCLWMIRRMSWRLLRQGLSVFGIILLITGGIFFLILFLPKGSLETVAETLPMPVEQERAPLGTPPPSLYWLGGGIVCLIAGFLIFYFLSDNNRVRTGESLLKEEFLLMEKKLRHGADFRNTILLCYGNMSRIVCEERKISREKYMTAEEFRDHILKSGMPEEPVRELTSLFERVRYGAGEYNRDDSEEALKWLQVIIRYLDRDRE